MRAFKPFKALAALAALAAAGALLVSGVTAAPAAQAAPVVNGKVGSATLSWGVKKSFRAYVKGGIARGTIKASGGARQAAKNGAFSFTSGSGTLRSGRGTITFKGSVNFKGHGGKMNLTLSDIKVQKTSAKAGYLIADAKAPSFLGKKAIKLNNKRIATVKITTTKASGGKVQLKISNVRLTADGSKAMGGFYPKGTLMDSASVKGTYKK